MKGIKMDIDYLLFLQDFRNGIDDALTPFMEMISLFCITYLMIVPAFIYWCIDKRSGLFTFASYSGNIAVNAVVKLSVCAYRPWIRDSRVLPAGDAITTATGYSFPSGHTMSAAPLYGGLAISTWKKMRWISVLCIICIALTAFSRNYLGVHTPQDVLVGLAISGLFLFGMSVLFKYLGEHPEKENYFLIGGVIFGIAAIIYITIKPYPMDYVDGKLLVDPEKMLRDGYGDIGLLIAFCVSRFIEKTWVKFEPKMTKASLAMGLTGAVLTFFINDTVYVPFRALFGLNWGTLLAKTVIIMFIITIWPAVMKLLLRDKATEAKA